jgi:hypothetical protein
MGEIELFLSLLKNFCAEKMRNKNIQRGSIKYDLKSYSHPRSQMCTSSGKYITDMTDRAAVNMGWDYGSGTRYEQDLEYCVDQKESVDNISNR